MNCKENDLALVVGAFNPADEALIGAIRKVTHVVAFVRGGVPAWAYEGERLRYPSGRVIEGLADDLLRPIRPDAEPVTNDVVAEVGA